MSDQSDYSIEEYRTLRTELLRNFDATERNLIACITANGVALAYGLSESEPLIFLIAALVPIYFWIQHANHRQSVAKIAAYIAVFHEREASGLQWEGRTQRANALVRRPRTPYLVRRFLHPYATLLVVTILLGGSVVAREFDPLLTGAISCCATLLVLGIAWAADVPYVKLREPWENAFKATLKESSSPKTEATPVRA